LLNEYKAPLQAYREHILGKEGGRKQSGCSVVSFVSDLLTSFSICIETRGASSFIFVAYLRQTMYLKEPKIAIIATHRRFHTSEVVDKTWFKGKMFML
jgi:hypothetical protein